MAEVVESLETSLTKVRRLTASALPHQSKPAQLLVAIESSINQTLSSTSTPTSTAYFVALLQCLEKACADEVGNDDDIAETENMGQGALIPATIYLLAIVIPETPSQVVISKTSPLLENILPLVDSALEHPPALRSLLQVITSLLLFAPPGLLSSSPLLKKAWNYLLELNLDPRPKVRHLAQEGVRKVLCTPVPPKMTAGNHPLLPRAREWVTGHLEEEIRSGGGGSSKKKARFAGEAEDGEGKKVIWIIQGLRGWVTVWGDEQLSSLCGSLLSLPPLPHLTPQIYSLLAHLLSPPPIDSAAKPSVLTNLPTIIDSLISSPPDIKLNAADVTTYLTALTSALIKMSIQDPLSLPSYLPKAFTLIFTNILLAQSASPATLTAASEAIGSQGIVRYCLTDDMILAAVNYSRQGSLVEGARKKQKTPFVTKIVAALMDAMDSHALRLGHLLPILTALVSRLRIRIALSGTAVVDTTGQGQTAAEELLLDLVTEIGDLRTEKGFEEKAKVDEVVGMAIEVMGVEAVLKALPLNIEPDASGNTPQPGRAHLLPLIRAKVTNDSLAFFTSYFRPLSERLFTRKVAAEEAGRQGEAKVWEVVVGQIWDCFPGFCEMPRDLKTGLTTPFLTLLTNLLYTQPTLLSPLLRGLSALVNTTQRLVNSATPAEELVKQFGIDQDGARGNVDYLKTLAKDMVSVLLNVFSKLPREQRGNVGEVIGAWVSIMTEQDVIATYTTVTTHLSTNLTTTAAAPGTSPVSHTMLDLLIIFVPHLPPTQSTALFTATATETMLGHHDATVQKKSYRLLKRLLEAGRLVDLETRLEAFVGKLDEAASGVGPGAQRDRLQLLAALVEILPKDKLDLLPEVLSEAVLGTKEVNERARDAGFDLLVVMAKKMAKGGVVKQQVPVDEDAEEDDVELQETIVEANVEEFITMVAAGLTGTTPHMISASLNALSRLVFEFKDDVSDATLAELVSTTAIFLQSKNREIVKSALGFIKLLTITLEPALITPHLPVLVPALLGWVHDHKNHFKQKTVHIFERMIRKFGFDAVYQCAPEGGERKVLDGIKKRKERAKRKKAHRDEDEDGAPAAKSSSGNAFEDILYNSDSDDSDDGSDEEDGRAAKSNGKGRPIKPLGKPQKGAKGDKGAKGSQTFIRDEGDEPMDLLSRSIAGGISLSDPKNKPKSRKPGQDAARFETDKSGRMIIPDDKSDDDEPSQPSRSLEGGAFVSAQRGVDGATRDARGNLKFNKNTKRNRAEEDDLDVDVEMPSVAYTKDEKRQKENAGRKKPKKLGEEFKAKRAGGDIKRNNGPDPYSYVPIGQAAAKGNKPGRVNLTNKKKGSRG